MVDLIVSAEVQTIAVRVASRGQRKNCHCGLRVTLLLEKTLESKRKLRI